MGLDDDEDSDEEPYEGCYTLDQTTLRCNDEGIKKLVDYMPTTIPDEAVSMIVLDIHFKVLNAEIN